VNDEDTIELAEDLEIAMKALERIHALANRAIKWGDEFDRLHDILEDSECTLRQLGKVKS
jgi:hypothetical protein